MITRKKVTAIRENFGTIPIIKGEENSEEENHRWKNRTGQEKNVSENREAIFKNFKGG